MSKPEGFQTVLQLEWISGKTWELTFPLHYISRSGRNLVVPAGFKTDLASVPWYARMFIPSHGQHTRAAVLHDWLLLETEYSWSLCNSIMREAMIVEGVGKLQIKLIYFGIEIWRLRFGNYRKQK